MFKMMNNLEVYYKKKWWNVQYGLLLPACANVNQKQKSSDGNEVQIYYTHFKVLSFDFGVGYNI